MAKRKRRKRKNPSDATLLLLVGGGAAAAYYFMVHRKKPPVVAPAPPPPAPNLADKITGIFGNIFGAISSAAKGVEQKVAARGPAHLAAWKAAMDAGDQYYSVRLMVLGKAAYACYETATGDEAAKVNCPVTQLEGLGATAIEYGPVRHTLSSTGYGSLR